MLDPDFKFVVGAAQGLLNRAALDELTQFAPNRQDHIVDVLVVGQAAGREKFKNSKHIPGAVNGKGGRAGEPGASEKLETVRIQHRCEVGNPNVFAVLPGSSRKTHSRGKG